MRHEVPLKAKKNREAVVVCAIHVVKRPSKRSVLVYYYNPKIMQRDLSTTLLGGFPLPVYSIGGGGGNNPPPTYQDRRLCYYVHLFGVNSMMIYYSLEYPICLCHHHLYTA